MNRLTRFFSRPKRTRWVEEPLLRIAALPHSLHVSCIYRGTSDDGETFMQQGIITRELAGDSRNIYRMSEDLRRRLNTFLDPLCRCRFGYHWRCSIHRGWKN